MRIWKILTLLSLLAAFPLLTAQAAVCTGGPLPPGEGDDLEVTGLCTVDAGTYHYGDINIYDGGALVFDDAVIDFWASSILIENAGSLIAGGPDNPIGTQGGVVTLHVYGADQGPDGVGAVCKSDVRCGIPETVWNSQGAVIVDLPGGVKDYFYKYIPLPLDGGDANGYFGYKVIGVSYGGSLELFGKKGASFDNNNPADSGTSWVRLATDPNDSNDKGLDPGEDVLFLDRVVDWQIGDEIVVTTTDYLPGHSEQLTITGVSGDRRSVSVAQAAHYFHNGRTYDLSRVPKRLGLDIEVDGQPAAETRAAVALLTRSIRIVSEGEAFNEPFPEASVLVDSTEQIGAQHPYYFGAHMILRQGIKTAQIQGVEFYQMGQGGRMGHYPIHFHVTRKTPADTFVKDSSVHDSMTRWITLHGAHGVTLARNVGYKSIGHGYYLEDGTEINNKFQSNIGIFARAAVDNSQNPRKVPGILAWTEDKRLTDKVPTHSDYAHPTVFWMLNTWNDFEHNMAAGAGACGACYWPLPAINSGLSTKQKWDSYASLQTFPDRAGATPLKKFRGNFCSTAMNSFNTTSNVSPCNGLGAPDVDTQLEPIVNPLIPAPNPNWTEETFYPRVIPGGLRFPTRCDENSPGAKLNPDTGELDCSNVIRCSEGHKEGCMVTTLDHYTTAFHWAETNFSAIWMRPQWFLVINSVISDVQSAGLTFVTGGDYTKSSSIDGNWLLARKNVFIGNTQQDNPLASHAGPFNPRGLSCDNKRAANYCLSLDEGITMPLSSFANNQRLFNLYDGPAQQDSNAYLDITKTHVEDCQYGNGNCFDSEYMYGKVLGMPFDADTQQCFLPNAAIAWKQPNGFYYPPSFHSTNLFFDDVDIRHFVIEPLFLPGAHETDDEAVKQNYCTFNATGSFTGFTSIDRQTVLNDDDGSLTGLAETISVNEDPFFNAPVETIECKSEGTAKTSPYQYVTTAVYPDCAARGNCTSQWSRVCTGQSCYGVPLYRQLLTSNERAENKTPNIRLMGQAIWQRSNLTPNKGVFYIDTTVSEDQQRQSGASDLNVFEAGETYYVYFVYAKPNIRQTYQMYVGKDFDMTTLKAVTTPLASAKLTFNDEAWPETWETQHDVESGLLRVTLDMGFDVFKDRFKQAEQNSCQPKSFCQWNTQKNQCACSAQLQQDNPELYAECIQDDHAICAWSVVDVDCPEGGCFGLAVTLPTSFETDPASDPRPPAACYPVNEDWDVAWQHAPPDLAGSCFNPPLEDTQFCDLQATPLSQKRIITGTPRDERLIGTRGPDIILGREGHDVIIGHGGDDWISGGAGDDKISGRAGHDTLYGDAGHDTISAGPGDDLVFGDDAEGDASIHEGHDSLDGGRGNDEIHGGRGNDEIHGGKGNDLLMGHSGDDIVNGNQGEDTCLDDAATVNCEADF